MAIETIAKRLSRLFRNPPQVRKRWRVTRALEGDPRGKSLPEWARHLMFGLYREQGWRACDQRQNGKTVATGKWGDELFLLDNGSIACTRYPSGYPKDTTHG